MHGRKRRGTKTGHFSLSRRCRPARRDAGMGWDDPMRPPDRNDWVGNGDHDKLLFC
ncbi:Uncharacterized protein ChrSV_0100 [Chromobacterium vaccinii]|nr:Uncharacterized protein ChrSW_0100 [Chromobacterium vaccinii]QND87559.1 Uncharacterized protein ChrSV_0100 [Chromobacterium vaccinii]